MLAEVAALNAADACDVAAFFIAVEYARLLLANAVIALLSAVNSCVASVSAVFCSFTLILFCAVIALTPVLRTASGFCASAPASKPVPIFAIFATLPAFALLLLTFDAVAFAICALANAVFMLLLLLSSEADAERLAISYVFCAIAMLVSYCCPIAFNDAI